MKNDEKITVLAAMWVNLFAKKEKRHINIYNDDNQSYYARVTKKLII